MRSWTSGCGSGSSAAATSGGALVRLIHDHADVIEAARRRAARGGPRGRARPHQGPRRCRCPPAASPTTPRRVVDDPDVDIVVEVIGGIEPARALIVDALMGGKPVVTANKELIATHGRELFETAEGAGVDILFEASVGGGIPLIRPLRESLAGDRIRRVMGIVNDADGSPPRRRDRGRRARALSRGARRTAKPNLVGTIGILVVPNGSTNVVPGPLPVQPRHRRRRVAGAPGCAVPGGPRGGGWCACGPPRRAVWGSPASPMPSSRPSTLHSDGGARRAHRGGLDSLEECPGWHCGRPRRRTARRAARRDRCRPRRTSLVVCFGRTL